MNMSPQYGVRAAQTPPTHKNALSLNRCSYEKRIGAFARTLENRLTQALLTANPEIAL
jgi:hypothetical protein